MVYILVAVALYWYSCQKRTFIWTVIHFPFRFSPIHYIPGKERAESSTAKIRAATVIYDKFAKSKNSPMFADTTADIFCLPEWIQQFAHYLVHKYVKSSGDGDDALAESSVLGYISGIMAAGKDKFENKDPDFFKVTGGRNSSVGLVDNWYVSMNNGIGKAIRHRSIEAGEKVGGDTLSLSRRVLFSIAAAYFAHNSEGAIVRRFALILLWHGVGRVAECILTNWALVEWFQTVDYAVLNWSQSKTGKQKGVAICPAKDGYALDFYHALGCYLSIGKGQDMNTQWVLDEDWKTISGKAVCKRIQTYLADCSQEGGAQEYGTIKIAEVDPGLSGISIRRGAINQCKAMGNTHEQCSFVSGHDMNGFSSLWSYIYIDSWDTIPGAMSLAGYLAPRHGQYDIGNIPKLPSFDVILKANLATTDQINSFVDNLFRVRLRCFCVHGSLRPLVIACAARMVQYFNETLAKEGEGHITNKAIITAGEDARPRRVLLATLKQWSTRLGDDFNLKNVPVADHTEGAILRLSGVVEKLTEELRESNIRSSNLENRVEALIAVVTGFEGLLKDSCRQNQSPSGNKRRRSNESSRDIQADEESSQVGDMSMVTENAAASSPSKSGELRDAVTSRADSDKFAAAVRTSVVVTAAAATAAPAAAATAAPASAVAPVLKHSSHSFNTISGLTLAQAMLKQVEAKATTFSAIYIGSRQDESRLNQTCDTLKKFLTAEEAAWLSTNFRDTDAEDWRGKVATIYEAGQARFSTALKAAESRCGITNNGKMLVNGVEGRLKALRKLNALAPTFSDDLLSKDNGIGYACVITGKGKRTSNNSKSNNSNSNNSNSSDSSTNSNSSSSSSTSTSSSDQPPIHSFFGAVGSMFGSSGSSSKL